MRILYKKSKIFLECILSYIVVMLIPIVALSFLLIRYSNSYETEIINSNLQYVAQIRSEADNMFHMALSCTLKIGDSSLIADFMESPNLLHDPQNSLKVFDLSKEITENIKHSNFFGSCYVYFKDADLVVDSTSVMKAKDFMDATTSMNYEEWTNLLNLKGWQTYTDKGNGVFVYIHQLESPSRSACVVSVVTQSDIQRIINVSSSKSGELFIAPPDLSNILYTKTPHSSFTFDPGDFKNTEGSFRLGKHIVIYSNSSISPLIVGYVNKTNNLFLPARTLYLISMIILLLSMLFVIALSLYFSYRTASPFENIARLLGNDKVKGYKDIYGKVSDMVDKKITLEQKVGEQSNILLKVIFEKLIKGEMTGFLSLINSLPTGSNPFEFDYFSVAVYMPNVTSGEEAMLSDPLPENIFAVIDSFSDSACKFFTHKFNDILVSIINIKRQDYDLSEKLTEMLQSLDMDLHISVSNIEGEYDNISLLYAQAMQTCEYHILFHSKAILFYNDIKDGIKTNYYYPLDDEYRLILSLKSGDSATAVQIFDKIWNNNFNPEVPNSNASLILSIIQNTLHKTILDVSSYYNTDFGADINLTFPFTPTVETKKAITNAIESICSKIQNANMTKKDISLNERIINYIYENYSDPALCVATIGEKFGLNPYYLSRNFKINHNQSILEFIHTVRIETSKKMLLDENNTNAIVAEAVGFSNVTTFNRVFKKLTGTSPKKYAQDHSQSK